MIAQGESQIFLWSVSLSFFMEKRGIIDQALSLKDTQRFKTNSDVNVFIICAVKPFKHR